MKKDPPSKNLQKWLPFRKPFQTFRYVWVFAFEDEAQPIYDQAGKFASTNEVEKVISK